MFLFHFCEFLEQIMLSCQQTVDAIVELSVLSPGLDARQQIQRQI